MYMCRAGIESSDSTIDRALFPDCRQACFTVDREEENEEKLFVCEKS